MITKQDIMDAYLHLRKTNSSIPSETLEFIRDGSLSKWERIENQDLSNIVKEQKKLSLKCTVGNDALGNYGLKDLETNKIIIPDFHLSRGILLELTFEVVE